MDEVSFPPERVFVCPVCRAVLRANGRSLRCASGHTYDMARSGYVNLLPPGRKSNARSGDPDSMVRARREFLSGGYYDRYVREAASLAAPFFGGGVMLDAACGEGHHTLILAESLRPALAVGIDASKKAADAAAKAANASSKAAKGSSTAANSLSAVSEADTGADFLHSSDSLKQSAWCTSRTGFAFAAGNIFDMPVASASCGLMTVLFAPIPFDEARRVLDVGGVLLTAGAGAEHLIELRRLIYDEVRIKNSAVTKPDGFCEVRSENISYKLELDPSSLLALFEMTPFCFRAGTAARDKIASSGGMSVTVSVDCKLYRKELSDENFRMHTDVQ